jgi:DNA-binding GntR family transcriptional regulator
MDKPAIENSDIVIARQPLHQLVAERIRDMIIEGRLAPGDQVNESKLCLEMGVSRTPMREAIRMLASEGLIVLRPGRSTVVRKFTPEEVRDMLDVVTELEALAGRQACRCASDEDIAGIEDLHARMMAHYRAGERLDYYKLNQRIHSAIVEASGNAALAEVHDLLQARMKRIRFVGNAGKEKWRGAVEEHEEMIEALRTRDEDRLAAILRRHLSNTWTRVADSV